VWAVRTSQKTHFVSATEPNRLMLFGETVAAYFEDHTEHKYTAWTVRNSQENITFPLRKILAVNTDSFVIRSLFTMRITRNTQIRCGQPVPHRKHHGSATEPNRLMLFGKTVAVYCEDIRNTHIHYVGSPYLAGNTTSPLQSPTG
jgi:hypothetical protein